MFCSQCGSKIDQDSAFCPVCGADLRSPGAEADPTESDPGDPAATRPSPPSPPAAPVPPPARPTPPPAPPVPAAPAAASPTAPMPPVSPVATASTAVGTGSYPKAPAGGRLLALIADSLIASALVPLGILLWIAVAMQDRVPVAGIIILGLGGLWQFGYTLARDAAGGAGPGKRLTGLVVVAEATGRPTGGGPAVVRQLVLFALGLIPAIGSFIEPVLVLVDKDGRRLGDKAAKTRVARASDVAAAGMPVPTGKGLAVGLLVAAILINLIGSTIGGIAVARAIAGAGETWEPPLTQAPQVPQVPPGAIDDEPPPGHPPIDGIDEPPVAGPTDGDPYAPPATGDPVSGLTPETAVEVVGEMLYALKNDDVGLARSFGTPWFQEEYDWFFYPSGGALLSFEVVDVYQDAAQWTVVVEEQWNSGPDRRHFFVTEENGLVLVNGFVFEDEF